MRFWLTSPEEIEASVNNLKGTVSVLDKIYDLRQRLKSTFYDNHPLIFRRADRALDRMLLRADRSELTDPELQNINLDRIRLTNRTYHFAAEFAEVGG